MTQEIIEKPMSAECTMKQYEAIPDADFVENREYQLTDYPDNGANADQMAFALTCQRLFPAGTVVTFSGITDSNYTNGHLYQIEVDDSGSKSWKDITPAGEQSIPILTGTQEKPIKLYTDLEVNKYYLLSGYIYYADGTYIRLQTTDGVNYTVLAYKTAYSSAEANVKLFNFAYDGISPASYRPSISIDSTISVTSSNYIRTDYTRIAGVCKLNGNNVPGSSSLSIYAPVLSGINSQILQSQGANSKPTWVDQTSITSKQQTYYLTELPTTTTSPYAEHDQVVVNNQDVYALEKVDSTLTWVKKYSIGGSGDESIVTLEGTQDNPILFSNIATGGIYVLKGYLKLTDSTTQNFNRPLLCQRIWGDKIVIWNAQKSSADENLQYFPGTMIILDISGDNYITTHNLTTISTLNGSTPNNFGKFADFYAPTTSGAQGQILQSNGVNNAPTWIDNTAPFVLDITDLTAKISDDNLTKLQNNKVAYINYTQTDSYTTKIYLYRKVSYYNTSIDNISYLRFVLMNNTNDDLSGVNEYLDVYLKTSLDGENPPEKGQIVQSSQKTLLTPSGTPTDGQVPVVKDNKLTWADMPTSTVDTELADSENPVQNKAIFNALKDKLGVLGPDEHNRVYIRKDNTTDSSLPFSYTAEADSIMKRNASGQVQVATPTQDDDAVNKSYADQLQRYLSLSGDSGVLEDEQYELVKNNDNLIIQRVGLDFRRCGYPSNGQGDYIFFCDHYTKPNGSEDWLDYFITIKQDKTWETTIKNHLQVAGQSYTPFVQLTPDTATQGNLSDDDYTNLTEHDDVYIILNNEYYRKADNQHTTGIISYTHQGWNGDTPQDKSINITVSTKAWTLVVGKTKYYRHYVQLTADSKALYYDFSSTQETAYTADTLPSMPDDIITTFQVVANGYYSTVSGLVYRNSENELKVIMHGMYTTDGTNMTYLQLTGAAATFVQDVVKTM